MVGASSCLALRNSFSILIDVSVRRGFARVVVISAVAVMQKYMHSKFDYHI